MIADGCKREHQNGFPSPAFSCEAVNHQSRADNENVNQIDPTWLAYTVISVEAIQMIECDEGSQNGNGGSGNPVASGSEAD